MADQYEYKATAGTAGYNAAYGNPQQVGASSNSLGTPKDSWWDEHSTDFQAGTGLVTGLIEAWSIVDTAERQYEMQKQKAFHDMRMSNIELDLNQKLANVELTMNKFYSEAEREQVRDNSFEQLLQIEIGKKKAAGAANVLMAGAGNVTGSNSVIREIQANALRAKAANEDELRAAKFNISARETQDELRHLNRGVSDRMRHVQRSHSALASIGPRPDKIAPYINAIQTSIGVGQAGTRDKTGR